MAVKPGRDTHVGRAVPEFSFVAYLVFIWLACLSGRKERHVPLKFLYFIVNFESLLPFRCGKVDCGCCLCLLN